MNPNVHSRMLSGHLLYIDFKRSFLIKYVAAHGCHIKKTFMAFTTLMKQIWKAVFEEGLSLKMIICSTISFYLPQFSLGFARIKK